jgi:hypothetical protein
MTNRCAIKSVFRCQCAMMGSTRCLTATRSKAIDENPLLVDLRLPLGIEPFYNKGQDR